MEPLRPWVMLLLVLLGNCGFWLFCFNRINSTGLPRRFIKRFEKILILVCFALPLGVATVEWPSLMAWMKGSSPSWWPVDAAIWDCWAAGSLIALAGLGPRWLASRLWLIPPPHLIEQTGELYRVNQFLGQPAAVDRITRWLQRLPGNEITQLEVTQKQLRLPRAIEGLDGLRIGHLSDIHLTGQLSLDFYRFVFARFMELQPDLILISGDIIDKADCLPWIEPLFGELQAPLGCSYVLGNHDCRLKDVEPLITRLNALGYHDLGVSDQQLRLACGSELHICGNERPWLRRQQSGEYLAHQLGSSSNARVDDDKILRIGVSHSPDQIGWARQRRLDLMLAGHTHGGQARFPLIGPIVAPSRYGSRYASGVFFLPPTLMHVSRGVAGTHPLRWRCPPEVSLLTLRR